MALDVEPDCIYIVDSALPGTAAAEQIEDRLVERAGEPTGGWNRKPHFVHARPHRFRYAAPHRLAQYELVPRAAHAPGGRQAEGQSHQADIEKRQARLDGMRHSIAVLNSQIAR